MDISSIKSSGLKVWHIRSVSSLTVFHYVKLNQIESYEVRSNKE
jgi:hypothetical protein